MESAVAVSEPLKLTTIAVGTVLKGTVEVDGSLRVDGTIEGEVTCHKTMVLGPQGLIKGNVNSHSAILQGTLKGDIHIKDELVLKAGCDMQGDIYTGKLEVEPKARFNGTCNTVVEESKPQPKPAAQPQQPQNKGNDGNRGNPIPVSPPYALAFSPVPVWNCACPKPITQSRFAHRCGQAGKRRTLLWILFACSIRWAGVRIC